MTDRRTAGAASPGARTDGIDRVSLRSEQPDLDCGCSRWSAMEPVECFEVHLGSGIDVSDLPWTASDGQVILVVEVPIGSRNGLYAGTSQTVPGVGEHSGEVGRVVACTNDLARGPGPARPGPRPQPRPTTDALASETPGQSGWLSSAAVTLASAAAIAAGSTRSIAARKRAYEASIWGLGSIITSASATVMNVTSGSLNGTRRCGRPAPSPPRGGARSALAPSSSTQVFVACSRNVYATSAAVTGVPSWKRAS